MITSPIKWAKSSEQIVEFACLKSMDLGYKDRNHFHRLLSIMGKGGAYNFNFIYLFINYEK